MAKLAIYLLLDVNHSYLW